MKDKLPIVTIVGRQNVGKSTLFNTIIKSKKAIVDPVPGLTRDILAYTVEHKSALFTLTDTPGLDIPKTAELSTSIVEATTDYLKRSSVIILLMENPAPESFDLNLANIIRKLSLPTIIAVNKTDNEKDLENMSNFYEVGFNDIIPISALRKFNIQLLLDSIYSNLPSKKTVLHEPDIKLSIVGRPNSGKSTLLNSFIGYERAIVSDIPGTTRDAIDETFPFQKKQIQIIDTAGIRKKSKIKENIEYYSLTRTIESINKCDVVIHLVDAEVGITETDKKISDEILKAKKPIIIAINKWDAIPKETNTFNEFKEKLLFKFYKAEDFPIISVSAKDKTRIHKLITTAFDLKEKAGIRIETPKLNNVLKNLQNSRHLPQLVHKIKILYAAQISTSPPEFKFFVNNQDHFRKDVLRYFEKALQKEFKLNGIPIILHVEGRKKKPKK